MAGANEGGHVRQRISGSAAPGSPLRKRSLSGSDGGCSIGRDADSTFTVTLEHPQQQDEEDTFVEPNGVVLNLEPFLQRVAEALAPFVADKTLN